MTTWISTRGICKRFPGVLALSDVDLALDRGEVLAVVGENGAGKSTLMKILAGVLQPDAGTLELSGEIVQLAGPSAAQRLGITLIHQELCLCERLDVASNICLGRESRRLGMLLDPSENRKRAMRVLERVGADLHPTTLLSELSIAECQLVEIAKAIEADSQVLIMDEPTSSLSLTESERLFSLVEELARSGTAVLYISHRLAEVERLADRVLVLRDGRVAGELARDQIDHQSMVRLMVGRDLSRFFVRNRQEPGETVLEVSGLATRRYPDQRIDLEVRAGEVVGVAGLVGAGRSEVLRALFLIEPPLEGRVEIAGRALDTEGSKGPSAALAAGLALVPEDRKQEGLFLPESVRRNLSIARLSRDASKGFVNRKAESALAERAIRETRIKTNQDSDPVAELSGGNQQKVVIGRAFAEDPKVLILDEPTRGVDIGARAEIYGLIDERAQRGAGVLFVSSEMEEILGLSDRCIVLHEGRVAGELSRDQLSEENVMLLATGAKNEAGEVA